jgi:hypothetical protein
MFRVTSGSDSDSSQSDSSLSDLPLSTSGRLSLGPKERLGGIAGKFFNRTNELMQAVRSYDDLIRAINEETRLASPASRVTIESLNELLLFLESVDKNKLFFVTNEPPISLSTSALTEKSITSSLDYEDIDSSCDSRIGESDLVAVSNRLEEYFSWFGEVETIYHLGTSIAVFMMKHAFSVTHILRSCLHEIPIPESLFGKNSPVSAPFLHPGAGRMMQSNFTVHGYESDSLSLNTILSLLKYVEPAEVLMVRRVNRLGFNGKSLVKRYFQQFGKVLRVFMLPLRSRKKNVTLPSKTGFVVMGNANCCEIILKSEEHNILPGITVSVGPFTHRGLVNTW